MLRARYGHSFLVRGVVVFFLYFKLSCGCEHGYRRFSDLDSTAQPPQAQRAASGLLIIFIIIFHVHSLPFSFLEPCEFSQAPAPLLTLISSSLISFLFLYYSSHSFSSDFNVRAVRDVDARNDHLTIPPLPSLTHDLALFNLLSYSLISSCFQLSIARSRFCVIS